MPAENSKQGTLAEDLHAEQVQLSLRVMHLNMRRNYPNGMTMEQAQEYCEKFNKVRLSMAE